MKSEDYYKRHGAKLIDFLSSDAGKDLIVFLQSGRPQFQALPHEHLVLENYGALRGYEQCIKNMIGACTPKISIEQPRPSYGVKEAVEPPPFVPFQSVPEQPQTDQIR